MIGIIGILGCLTIIGVGVSVVAVGVSAIVGKSSMDNAADAAKRQEDLQAAAIKKTELRANGQILIQNVGNAKRLQKMRAQAVTAVLMEKALANDAKLERAGKMREARKLGAIEDVKVTAKPSRSDIQPVSRASRSGGNPVSSR